MLAAWYDRPAGRGRRARTFRLIGLEQQLVMSTAWSDITVDRLPEAGSSLEVVILQDAQYGSGSEAGPRQPHRHDYHELVWTRSGTGRHLIDDEARDGLTA